MPHEIPSGSENPRRSRTRALRERRAAANRPQAFRTNDEAGPDAAPDGSTEAPLAGFSLLADPATISGGGHVASSPDRDEELDRLRSALHARSLEIERLRHRDAAAPSASSQPPAPIVSATPAPAETGRLLDAREARRLADEAHRRERAIREELDRARQALEEDAEATPSAPAPRQGAGAWQTRPLARATEPDARTSERSVPTPHVDARAVEVAPDAPAQPRADAAAELEETRAELRALRTTLALARETATSQRSELGRLRTRLDALERGPAEAPTRNTAEATANARSEAPTAAEQATRIARIAELEATLAGLEADRRHLRERLEVLEREAETREADRALLRRMLAQRDAELAARDARVESLHDRLEAQDRALDTARRAFEQERRRHTASQAVLARLRETLALAAPEDSAGDLVESLEAAALGASVPEAVRATRRDAEQASSAHAPDADGPEAAGSTDTPPSDDAERARAAGIRFPTSRVELAELRALLADEADDVVGIGSARIDASNAESRRATQSDGPARPFAGHDRVELPGEPSRRADGAPVSSGARPAIFEVWLDDQVQRHFGPMGLDRVADLLAAPLAQRARSPHDDLAIVLLGRDAEARAWPLADSLIAQGAPSFRIHVGDTAPGAARGRSGARRPSEAPIAGLIERLPEWSSAGALADRLDALAPAVIVSSDFLSAEDDVDEWLPVLEAQAREGACLLFIEATGVAPLTAPAEIAAIGDRIWKRMPERYTRLADGGGRATSWSDAYRRLRHGPANGLWSALRARFRFDLCAQFGFLVEPFLQPGIGANFDPDAARDRRFLRQLADVDDRKIEAGLAPALHLIARVDPLAEA